jgi:hypothetical protein
LDDPQSDDVWAQMRLCGWRAECKDIANLLDV